MIWPQQPIGIIPILISSAEDDAAALSRESNACCSEGAHVEICQAHPARHLPQKSRQWELCQVGVIDSGKIRQEHTWKYYFKYMSSTPRAVSYPEESRSRNYVQRVVPSLLTFGKQPLLPRRPLNKIPTPSSPAWGMMPGLSAAASESFAFFPRSPQQHRVTCNTFVRQYQ